MSPLSISIGADHAGFQLKSELIPYLKSLGHTVEDFGAPSEQSVDYPDFAHPTAEAVANGRAERGILICGSGNGVAITANKHQTVRCGLCWNEEVASLIRLHNDANMIALPARFITLETALQILAIFLTTEFEGGRHATRVGKIAC